MRFTNNIVMKLGGLAITGGTRLWMRTLDYQVSFYDPTVDPAAADFRGPGIYLFWHEYIPFLFYLRGNCRIAMLLSRHQDAEWLSQAARHMGFGTVRGSTSRGGVAALRELMRTSATMNLTITPDGPRGPRRRLASGCIYASSRLGIPLVPVGLGYDRPWRVRRAWDQFAVPRPYLAGTRRGGAADADPRRSGSGRGGALSPASRASAECADRQCRTVGRIGRDHGGASSARRRGAAWQLSTAPAVATDTEPGPSGAGVRHESLRIA